MQRLFNQLAELIAVLTVFVIGVGMVHAAKQVIAALAGVLK